MFAVNDIDNTVSRLQNHGATLVGDIVEFNDTYRLCYIRGVEGILIGLAEDISGR